MIFKCPKCKQSLEIDKKFIGEIFRCPVCKNYLQVRSIYGERSALPSRPHWNVTDAASDDEPKEPIDFVSLPIEKPRSKSLARNDPAGLAISDEYLKVVEESADEKYKLFLDVELSKSPDDRRAEITVINWWMDGRWGTYVVGLDSYSDFIRSWNQSRMLVTFCGKSIYEKYILRKFRLKKHPYHIDVHDFHKGDLHEVSKKLGFKRPEDLAETNALSPFEYWNDFIKKYDMKALDKLLYYNAWNVILIYQLYKTVVKQPVENEIIERIPFKLQKTKPVILEVFVDPKYSKEELDALWTERRATPLVTLKGAEICFVGELQYATRLEITAIVVASGGVVRNSACNTLDYLVVGRIRGNIISSIQKKVEANIENGCHTRIIDEIEFLNLLTNTFRSAK